MATATGLSPSQVVSLIQQGLIMHRKALETMQDLYRWTSTLNVADMATATGLSTADATTYLSAVADANAEAQIHFTGLPPQSYPQPASDYVYATTQVQVIGPQ
jgi:hypothetical protein